MCVFCDISAGSATSHRVLEEDEVLGFLDSRPLFPGHCLVIPRTHHETLADLPAAAVPGLFDAVRRLSIAVVAATHAQGSFVAVNNRVSQSVPHLHVHVVPRTKGDGLRGFFWPRKRYRNEAEMARTAAAIAGALREGSA